MLRRSGQTRPVSGLLAVCFIGAAFILTTVLFNPVNLQDDAYITFWPAYTLAHSGQIVNYAGQAVEQSSTLLLVIFTGTISKFTALDISTTAYLVCLIATLLSLVMVYQLAQRFMNAGAAVLLTLTTFAYFPIFYWTYSAMESTLTLFVSLLLIAVWTHYLDYGGKKFSIAIIVLVTLAFLTVRPETPLILGCVIVGFAVYLSLTLRRGILTQLTARRGMVFVGLSVLLIAALFVFRQIFFNSWFPQPVTAKAGGALDLSHIAAGWDYLAAHLLWKRNLPFTFLLMVGFGLNSYLALSRQTVPLWSILGWFFVVAYVAYIIFSGGDWMPNQRFFVPVMPVLMLLSVFGYVVIFKNRAAIVYIILAVFLATHLYTDVDYLNSATILHQSTPLDSQAKPQIVANFETIAATSRQNQDWTLPVTYRLDQVLSQLSQAKPDQRLSIMGGQMGEIMYALAPQYTANWLVYDRHGLIDRNFTGCPEISKNVGHSRFGIGMSYPFLLDHFDTLQSQCGLRKPDIIFDTSPFATKDYLLQHGYTIVFLQYDSRSPNPDENYIAWFIAVNNDLLPLLKGIAPAIFDLSAK